MDSALQGDQGPNRSTDLTNENSNVSSLGTDARRVSPGDQSIAHAGGKFSNVTASMSTLMKFTKNTQHLTLSRAFTTAPIRQLAVSEATILHRGWTR